jgi:hypothetical protein
MTLPRIAADVLSRHVVFEIESMRLMQKRLGKIEEFACRNG